jgi:hypothetical protein
MSNVQRVNTPAGPATELKWPVGVSYQFFERISNNVEYQSGDTVDVMPVLLDSGKVRFYREGVLKKL